MLINSNGLQRGVDSELSSLLPWDRQLVSVPVSSLLNDVDGTQFLASEPSRSENVKHPCNTQWIATV